jgi:hypothetical protein
LRQAGLELKLFLPQSPECWCSIFMDEDRRVISGQESDGYLEERFDLRAF